MIDIYEVIIYLPAPSPQLPACIHAHLHTYTFFLILGMPDKHSVIEVDHGKEVCGITNTGVNLY